jgi:integrase
MEASDIRSDGVCVHSLRHTAATKADEAGKPILAIRDMLGHKSVKTTEIYIHSIRRIKDAAELGINYGIKRKKKKKKKKRKPKSG